MKRLNIAINSIISSLDETAIALCIQRLATHTVAVDEDRFNQHIMET
jgi:hypothetical protein